MRLAFLMALVLLARPALALIITSTGNAPIDDRQWPAGAVDLANLKTRVGWMEGPPFGGGQHQFFYRGDTADFQRALDAFAQIRWPQRHLVVHEGPRDMAFLRNSNDPNASAKVDWSLTLWSPQSWYHLFNNPASTVFADDPHDRFRRPLPPPVIDLYLPAEPADPAAGIDFSKIKIPSNVTVIDERATAAGYARDAAPVIRGDAYDMLTSKPIPSADVIVEKHTGNNAWERIASTKADERGHFELTQAPIGSYRITIASAGHVPRVMGHAQIDANTLKEYTAFLAPPAELGGTVTDTNGKPLAGAKVATDEILASDGRAYLIPQPPHATTDADGRFTLTGLPAGHLRLSASAPSYQMLDVLKLHAIPSSDVALRLTATGTVTGKVLNADDNTHISINPPGDPIGKWGGSTKVNPDGTFRFQNVPPGPYTLSTNPLAPRAGTDPKSKSIEVKAGQTVEVELAK